MPEHSASPETQAAFLETVEQTDTPVTEEPPAEAEERASKQRSRHEEESASTERTEEEWRPAYKDAEPDTIRKPVAVIVRRPGSVAENPGYNQGGRGVPSARKPERAMKTLADKGAPPLLKGQGVREKAALPPPAGQSAASEYGRRKLMRELAAKQSDVPLLEANAPKEPLPLPAGGAEYQTPQMSESPVTRTGKARPNLSDALSERADVGDSWVTVKMKKPPTFAGQLRMDVEIIKKRKPSPSAPRSGSASADGSALGVTPNGATSETESAPKASQTERVGVETREARIPDDVLRRGHGAKADAQGKQKAVRERTEQVAQRRTDSISAKRESVSVSPETSVPSPEQSAVPVKMKTAYAQNETPSAEPEAQSAAQGKQKLVRERMEQVAERRVDAASGREFAANANTSAPIPKREAVPVKTKEAYAQRETPSAAQGKWKLIRERTEQVAGRRIDAGAQQSLAVKGNTSASTPEQRKRKSPQRRKTSHGASPKPFGNRWNA